MGPTGRHVGIRMDYLGRKTFETSLHRRGNGTVGSRRF